MRIHPFGFIPSNSGKFNFLCQSKISPYSGVKLIFRLLSWTRFRNPTRHLIRPNSILECVSRHGPKPGSVPRTRSNSKTRSIAQSSPQHNSPFHPQLELLHLSWSRRLLKKIYSHVYMYICEGRSNLILKMELVILYRKDELFLVVT